MRLLLLVTAIAALTLSACAPAVPTIDPASVQASAVAAARTMIAMTVAAVPSNTPVPPIPLPTDTPVQLPTLAPVATLPALASPTTASSGTAQDCSHIMDVGASGPTAPVVVQNLTKGPISGSIGIYGHKNTFGQCGYISFGPIAKGNSATVSVPLVHTNMGDSCYYAGAYLSQGIANGGPFCIDSAQKWTLKVGTDKITIVPP